MHPTILVIDDDVTLTKHLETSLSRHQYKPVIAHTAEEGVHLALTANPQLILLDVMIPTMGGWEACRRIREKMDVPILFLTALGNTSDVVHGLNLGADDYLVKPFEPEEFLARIKANLRRTHAVASASPQLSFRGGELIIDIPARMVIVNGGEVELTPREFDLLLVLAQNPNRVIPTTELITTAWGANYGDASDNLKPYIHYLRRKLEKDPAQPIWIKTVRGVGYRFMD